MTVLNKETMPLAGLLTGFLLWAGAFILIYMTQATGCRLGWHQVEVFGMMTLQRSVLVALYLSACGLQLGLMAVAGRSKLGARSGFIHRTGRVLSVAAIAASVFCFSGVMWLTTC